MRTFVYDNYGCDLLRCMFAGMNMDGRAQWLLDTADDFYEVLRNEAGFRPSMRLEIERELDRNLPKKLLEKYSKKRVY